MCVANSNATRHFRDRSDLPARVDESVKANMSQAYSTHSWPPLSPIFLFIPVLVQRRTDGELKGKEEELTRLVITY